MKKNIPAVQYQEYLQLSKILDAHHLRSEEFGEKAHDESLFITVHQAYEIWFKQILIELDSILGILKEEHIEEKQMGLVVSRLQRINSIFRLVLEQIPIMETMTPMDFLDFREFLYPASGFQSQQFRLIENKLGLKKVNRLKYNDESYEKSLHPSERQAVLDAEEGPNLLSALEKWLARTPFLKVKSFDFWKSYKQAVEKMFEEDREVVLRTDQLGKEGQKRNLAQIDASRGLFESLFDKNKFEAAQKSGDWSLSYEALQAALFIQLYRDQPVLQSPFNLIFELQNLDELLTNWRYRHALMAQRMLGTKIGTGGSSGFQYLRSATEQHRIFKDFTQLTTFFIPKSRRPDLPREITSQLGYIYES